MVNYTKAGLALLLSVTASQAWGMEVPAMKPSALKAIRLIHKRKSFQVVDKGKTHAVPSHWVDKEVRAVSTARLAKMLDHGYLSVNKLSNGEFSVKANGRLQGGGPALGVSVYWGVKSTLYGLLGGAAAATAAGTGVAIVGALGGAGALAGAGTFAGKVALGGPVAIAAKTLVVGAGLAGNVATVAGVAGTAAAPVIAETATVVIATGGWATLIAAVEGISVAAGLAAGMAPTP